MKCTPTAELPALAFREARMSTCRSNVCDVLYNQAHHQVSRLSRSSRVAEKAAQRGLFCKPSRLQRHKHMSGCSVRYVANSKGQAP